MPKYAIGFAPTGPEKADIVLLADDVCTAQLLGADVPTVSDMLAVAGVETWELRNAFAKIIPGTVAEGETVFATFGISPGVFNLLKGKL